VVHLPVGQELLCKFIDFYFSFFQVFACGFGALPALVKFLVHDGNHFFSSAVLHLLLYLRKHVFCKIGLLRELNVDIFHIPVSQLFILSVQFDILLTLISSILLDRFTLVSEPYQSWLRHNTISTVVLILLHHFKLSNS